MTKKYEHNDIALLVAELRRFSQAVIGGPHDKAADVLLELWDDLDRQATLIADYKNMYLLKLRENERYRRKLNLQNMPLLRNTADADMEELIELHNKARVRASWAWSISPLDKDDKLMAYAQAHANWMAERGRMRHSSMRNITKLGFTRAGENIAWGQDTPADVLQAWLWSPGHRRNIMSTKFNKIGCGATKDDDGRLYWCVCFGQE